MGNLRELLRSQCHHRISQRVKDENSHQMSSHEYEQLHPFLHPLASFDKDRVN